MQLSLFFPYTVSTFTVPTLRQRLRWHLDEVKRRFIDVYRVLIHGADVMDEDY